MNLLIEGLRRVIEEFTCCRGSRRTMSNHNLITEEQELAMNAVPLVARPSGESETHLSKAVNMQKKHKSSAQYSPWIDDPHAVKLWVSCCENDLQTAQELLNSNTFELDTLNADGQTILHKAVLLHNLQLVRLLLESTQSININSIDKHRRTALHLACIENCTSIVRYLLSSGALINMVDYKLNTALHYAVVAENIEVIKCLMNMYPDTEVVNNEGVTVKDLMKLKNLELDSASEMLAISHLDDSENNEMQNSYKSDRPLSLKDFEIVQSTGKSTLSEMCLARLSYTGELFTMKVLQKSKFCTQNIAKYVNTEKNILSYVHNPFIIRLNYAFQDLDKVYLVFQYCPGGNLMMCIGRYKKVPEDIARIYMSEILLALAELHRRGIVYRDLKPDNVALDAHGHVMLIGIGLTKEGLTEVIGDGYDWVTPYIAPEVIRGLPHGKPVDWYLFGVLLYEMLVGRPPYYNNDAKTMLSNIEHEKLKYPSRISAEAHDLLKSLLKKQPNKRIGTVNDADEVKDHPFFKGIDWGKVYSKQLEPPIPPISLIRAECLTISRSPNSLLKVPH